MSMKIRRTVCWVVALAGFLPAALAERPSEGWGLPYGWEVDLAGEAVLSSDIQLSHYVVGLADRQTTSQFTLRLVQDVMSVDYEPIDFDLNGESTHLHEQTLAVQGSFRHAFEGAWTGLISGSAYDGYADYRSLWLAEYYRQQFSGLGDIPGFDLWREPDPHGVSFSAGMRWEYLPASGFLQLDLAHARDVIAPGYEIDFDGLVSGPSVLTARSIGLTLENVLTPRLRTLLQLQAAETTGRDPRLSALFSANLAFNTAWRIRGRIGGATEGPDFRSLYGSLAVEGDLSETWTVFATVRGYEDNGEIEDALLFSAAAPGLTTGSAGIGIKGTHRNLSWRLAWTPYRTDYEETGLGTIFFSNLYRDRSWNIFELSGVFTF
ncbi:MAG: hypothetical protein R3F07_12940 [Opitutaceae bacterium]